MSFCLDSAWFNPEMRPWTTSACQITIPNCRLRCQMLIRCFRTPASHSRWSPAWCVIEKPSIISTYPLRPSIGIQTPSIGDVWIRPSTFALRIIRAFSMWNGGRIDRNSWCMVQQMTRILTVSLLQLEPRQPVIFRCDINKLIPPKYNKCRSFHSSYI